MKTFSILLAVAFCLVSAEQGLAAKSTSRWPHALERGRYQAKIADTGKILWSVDWETRVREMGGKQQIEIREEGEGKPWKHKEPITWEKTMVFSAPESHSVQVESVKGERRDPEGNLLSEMEVKMDPPSGKITYRESQDGEAVRPAILPWTPQALPDELLFHWARTLPFEEEKGGAECMLLVSPKRQFKIQARVRGTEQVTTPAGTFSCYRVELAPRLLGPLKALAPKMFLWCRTDPPHSWVRYQGPVGGPGSPQAVIELVRFDED